MGFISIISNTVQLKPVIASSLGLLAHNLVFIHGEWHLQAPTIFVVHILLAVALIVAEILRGGFGYPTFNGAFMSIVCYFASLFGSITIYRLYFHRLRHFPGPRLAAVSKLWHVWQCRDSRNHLLLERLYHEYGYFVRTGPEEITMFTPGAFEAMDGPKSNTTRSDWYDLLKPRASSIFTRDKIIHGERRRLWSHALSNRAVVSYKPRVLKKIMDLKDHLDRADGLPVRINKLMQLFSFDLMGAFGFSEDFGMMENQEYHYAISMVRSAITLLGPFGPAAWIPRLAFGLIPGFWKVKDWFGMLEFCDKCISRRMKTGLEKQDVASWFIEDTEKNKDNKEIGRWLSGDIATLVVAGSDTTSPSLTAILYFLAKHPEHAEIIYTEISKINIHDTQDIDNLPHLNGAINESMRLLPAVLTFVMRVTPPEGINVDGTFIPGNVTLAAPRFTIGRLESAWKDPLKFCPERWYSKPDMIIDRRAFAPFGLGRTACAGKHLALAEIRMVVAVLLSVFRISFCPGDKGESVERDMLDQLTANHGDLKLVFTRR